MPQDDQKQTREPFPMSPTHPMSGPPDSYDMSTEAVLQQKYGDGYSGKMERARRVFERVPKDSIAELDEEFGQEAVVDAAFRVVGRLYDPFAEDDDKHDGPTLLRALRAQCELDAFKSDREGMDAALSGKDPQLQHLFRQTLDGANPEAGRRRSEQRQEFLSHARGAAMGAGDAAAGGEGEGER